MTTRTKLIRATTGDRGPPDGGVTIHTVEQLGPNMSKLANGSLLCRQVPLSRTGWMMYGPNETPITPGERGVAYVERTPETLFAESCVTSFVGASIVDEHPNDDVTPANWKKLAKGMVLTAWQGTNENSDVVLGDILVTDEGLIKSILDGKREVSAGYDADYEQVSEGIGRQTNIIVNHVALVEKGRCGPRCAIGDREYDFLTQPEKEKPMATQRVKITTGKRRAVLDGLRRNVRDAEAALAEEESMNSELDGDDDLPGGNGDTHIHIHAGGKGDDVKTGDESEDPGASQDDPYEARFTAIEGALSQINETLAKLGGAAGGETKDVGPGAGDDPHDNDDEDKSTMDSDEESDDDKKDGKTMDSAALETSFNKVLAQAEVLVPGFRMPTFDAKMKRVATIDAMCGARRKALDIAYSTKDGANLINGISGKTTLDLAKMGCKDVAVLFNAASGAKAAINNASTKDSGIKEVQAPKTQSIADINKANAEFWAKRQIKQ